ncbi:LysR family transcriptional regulator [Actinokineospora guangxiensis]|uniref:LysR family transcriptional regulator n=1 Tax=Actinokineospora guangxiensis TaxID=1490288 RepID=A0ABW0EGW0_9PSEU
MTLQQLAYFLAVARTLNFTRAAAEARVAQPSLSKQIRVLESELGSALFTRTPSVALTPAGAALVPIASRILSDVDSARLEVAELAGLRRGRIRLGATPSLCVGVLPAVLRAFHDEHPGVRLRVQESGSGDLTAALVAGELDLALVIVPPQGVDPALRAIPVLRDELVVASAEELPERMRVADLRTRPMVMYREGYDLRETTLAACRSAGFEPALAVEGGEMDAVLRFVEAGLGVAVVPRLVLADRPRLRSAALAGMRRTVAIAHRSDAPPTSAARAFRELLLAHVG